MILEVAEFLAESGWSNISSWREHDSAEIEKIRRNLRNEDTGYLTPGPYGYWLCGMKELKKKKMENQVLIKIDVKEKLK